MRLELSDCPFGKPVQNKSLVWTDAVRVGEVVHHESFADRRGEFCWYRTILILNAIRIDNVLRRDTVAAFFTSAKLIVTPCIDMLRTAIRELNRYLATTLIPR